MPIPGTGAIVAIIEVAIRQSPLKPIQTKPSWPGTTGSSGEELGKQNWLDDSSEQGMKPGFKVNKKAIS